MAKFRRWGLGGLFLAVFIIGLAAMCASLRAWYLEPRVRVADVEQRIRDSLPIGTPKREVETWLTAHSMVIHDDGQGRIESWILNAGPRSELPFGIRDIRVEFFFDEDTRLVRFTLEEEERF